MAPEPTDTISPGRGSRTAGSTKCQVGVHANQHPSTPFVDRLLTRALHAIPDLITSHHQADCRPVWWGALVIKVAGRSHAIYDKPTDTYVDDHGRNHHEQYRGSRVLVVVDRDGQTAADRARHQIASLPTELSLAAGESGVLTRALNILDTEQEPHT